MYIHAVFVGILFGPQVFFFRVGPLLSALTNLLYPNETEQYVCLPTHSRLVVQHIVCTLAAIPYIWVDNRARMCHIPNQPPDNLEPPTMPTPPAPTTNDLSRAPALHRLQQQLRDGLTHPVMAGSPVVAEIHTRAARAKRDLYQNHSGCRSCGPASEASSLPNNHSPNQPETYNER